MSLVQEEPVKDTITRSGPIHARPAWAGEPSKTHREFNARHKGEWLPVPYRGRIMQPSQRRERPKPEPGQMRAAHLMIVPGPGGAMTWMIVRLELNKPVARGFRTKEQARGWIGRAVRAGVLPEGVVEVEPPGPDGQEEP